MAAVLSSKLANDLRCKLVHSLKRPLSNFCVHPKVREALKNDEPVVALESTIITHGMPPPTNVDTATSVERIIKEQGAIPATIAVLDGKVHVGLSEEELHHLSSRSNLIKISRRDLPYALGKGMSGGTTVSATMLIAKRAGIPVFVTGGIGGVHRGAETSFDISADLTELGRTPITVISSGVKSILDIGKTLEYLETQGVCVVTYGSSTSFPSFFTSTSDFTVPTSISSPREAAAVISSRDNLGLENGILIAVPIPDDFQTDKKQIDDAIRRALEKAESHGVKGKAVTPFLLEEVNAITKGRSLQSNIALIQNNALVGAKIAVELKNLERSQKGSSEKRKTEKISGQRVPESVMDNMRIIGGGDKDVKEAKDDQEVVVIGGSIVDFVATVLEEDIKLNATTHRGNIRRSFGGVARNVADCLTRLGHKPLFLSAVGTDNLGEELIQHNKAMVTRGFTRIPGKSTATYCVILDRRGNFAFGIGDMSVHQELSIQYVESYMDQISKAKLVVMDGNSPLSTIEYVLDRCKEQGVPVWYETTDVQKAVRPFQKDHVPRSLQYISPNIIELNAILNTYKLPTIDVRNTGIGLQEEVSTKCKSLLDLVPNIVVTMGHHGVAVITRTSSQNLQAIDTRYYPAPDVPEKDIVSVSGAGDCFAGGYISGLLRGYSIDKCSQLGTLAAKCSLIASPAVPESITASLVDSI